MKRRTFLAGLCLLPCFQLGGEQEAPVAPRTVILVRHAEKAAEPGSDPELSPVGRARAEALARLLSSSGATRLFASEYQRTRATLAPLAAELELEVQRIPARAEAAWRAAFAELEAGSVSVIAGHSNTVPALVAALGGEVLDLVEHPTAGLTIADDTYDRLFVLSVPVGLHGPTTTLELRYGTE